MRRQKTRAWLSNMSANAAGNLAALVVVPVVSAIVWFISNNIITALWVGGLLVLLAITVWLWRRYRALVAIRFLVALGIIVGGFVLFRFAENRGRDAARAEILQTSVASGDPVMQPTGGTAQAPQLTPSSGPAMSTPATSPLAVNRSPIPVSTMTPQQTQSGSPLTPTTPLGTLLVKTPEGCDGTFQLVENNKLVGEIPSGRETYVKFCYRTENMSA
jgi:hypothetical protein